MKIGVLALQGAVAEHIRMLSALNTEAVPVRFRRGVGSMEKQTDPTDLEIAHGLCLQQGDLRQTRRV